MGNEMSCPCSSSPNPFEDKLKKQEEAVNLMLNKRFSKNDLIFSFEYNNTKLCVIPTEKIESFFKNKNSIKYNIRKEMSVPYNNINIANCLNRIELTIVVLEYYDLSTKYHEFDDNGENNNDRFGLKLSTMNESILNIRVNDMNIPTNNNLKTLEMIHMNINNMLKTDYIFMGVINTSNSNLREYKFLFKKILKYDNQFQYDILFFEGSLSKGIIEQYLKENPTKSLKAVLNFYQGKSKKEKNKGKTYYFIFEKNILYEKKYDNLVFEYKKKMMPDAVYFQDVVKKLNNMQNQDIYNYKLSCLIADDDNCYFVMNEEIQHNDTPDTNV